METLPAMAVVPKKKRLGELKLELALAGFMAFFLLLFIYGILKMNP